MFWFDLFSKGVVEEEHVVVVFEFTDDGVVVVHVLFVFHLSARPAPTGVWNDDHVIRTAKLSASPAADTHGRRWRYRGQLRGRRGCRLLQTCRRGRPFGHVSRVTSRFDVQRVAAPARVRHPPQTGPRGRAGLTTETPGRVHSGDHRSARVHVQIGPRGVRVVVFVKQHQQHGFRFAGGAPPARRRPQATRGQRDPGQARRYHRQPRNRDRSEQTPGTDVTWLYYGPEV